ncbi:hypothetical protein LCGC14_0960590 [marine sediment metagenome]|uniref:Uncharacterized protein n=1 Tax=marine sediment metagenome TaxID=412755 RepID=A0A0F9QXR0_9ZZZZ
MKTCPGCKQKFPVTAEYFYTDRNRKTGLTPRCKGCLRKQTSTYAKSDRGRRKRKQYNSKHCKNYYATVNGHLRIIFNAMLQRCYNPNCKDYKYYGRRGIKVCFTSDGFVNYVVNVLHVDPRDLTIDRIDNDGNYEPDNIRFVTMRENNKNKGARR